MPQTLGVALFSPLAQGIQESSISVHLGPVPLWAKPKCAGSDHLCHTLHTFSQLPGVRAGLSTATCPTMSQQPAGKETSMEDVETSAAVQGFGA